MSEEKKEKAYRPLEAQALLNQLGFRHMLEGHAASEEGKLAWVTSGFPVEIPVSMMSV